MNLSKIILEIILISVGSWLIIIPLYDWIAENIGNSPFVSIIIGIIIIYIAVKYFRMRV